MPTKNDVRNSGALRGGLQTLQNTFRWVGLRGAQMLRPSETLPGDCIPYCNGASGYLSDEFRFVVAGRSRVVISVFNNWSSGLCSAAAQFGVALRKRFEPKFGFRLRRQSVCTFTVPIAAMLLAMSLPLAMQAQEVPEPELPSVVDFNNVNLATGTLSIGHTYGAIGPGGELLSRSDQFVLDGFGKAWSLSETRGRDNLGNFEIFYDFEESTFAVSADKVKIRFSYSYHTKQFTPLEDTFATLENVSGTDNFSDLVYNAENGSIYTFEGGDLSQFHGSGAIGHLKKVERPNGEIFEVSDPSPFEDTFRYSNLGYSATPYLTNLADLRCASTACAGYQASAWPGEQHNAAPTATMHGRVDEDLVLGDGSTVNLPARYTYADIDFKNGDRIRAFFDLEFFSGGTSTPSDESRVTSVERHGSTWTYEYSGYQNSIATVTDPSGRKDRYTFNTEFHNLESHEIIPSDGGPTLTTSFTYSNNRLTKIVYPEGNELRIERDSDGRITSLRKVAKPGAGLPDMVTSYTYDACSASTRKYCGRPRTITDERGQVTKYKYSAIHGGLIETQSPFVSGTGYHKTSFHYTELHAWYLSSAGVLAEDPRGIWLKTKELKCVVSSETASCNDGNPTTHVTEYHYEQGNASTPSNLNLVKTIVRSGDSSLLSETAYEHDSWGRRQTEDGPVAGASDKKWYEYDLRSNLVRTTSADPDGAGPQSMTYDHTEYNPENQVLYEESGWTTSSSESNRSDTRLFATSYTYYNGRLITRTAQASDLSAVSLSQTSYDASGRIECEALRMDVSTYGSLPNSACTQSSNGNDRIHQSFYDPYGRLYKTARGVGTSVSMSEETGFTDNGQIKTRQDGNGNITTYEYDGHDRLVKTRYPNTTGSGSSSTDYESWTYLVENGLATPLEHTYRRRNGSVISTSYDELSRIVSKDAPGTGDDISFAYDIFGQVETKTRGSNTLTFDWDVLGRLESETSPIGSVSYEYDSAGRRTKLIWPDLEYVTYEYDGASKPLAIREGGSTVLASYVYDAFGRATNLSRANGIYTSFGYDSASRLNELDYTLPSDTSYNQQVDYSYNAARQITSKSLSNPSYLPDRYLMSELYGTNGLNQITGINGSVFSYDALGNMTTDGQKSYTYNIYNQLIGASGGVSLSYDAEDRLSIISDAEITQLLYDGEDLIAEYDQTGNMLRRYVHAPGMEAAIVWYEGSSVGSAARQYLVDDERGSVILVTDAHGSVIQQNKYDAYGVPDAANLGRFQYTGQTWLDGIEAYYYKARIYEPTIGKFLQTDPIGYEDQMNLYAYVGNDPVNVIDPSGLERFKSCYFREQTIENEKGGVTTLLHENCFEYEVPTVSDWGWGAFPNKFGPSFGEWSSQLVERYRGQYACAKAHTAATGHTEKTPTYSEAGRQAIDPNGAFKLDEYGHLVLSDRHVDQTVAYRKAMQTSSTELAVAFNGVTGAWNLASHSKRVPPAPGGIGSTIFVIGVNVGLASTFHVDPDPEKYVPGGCK